jgi:riboflavin kinase/FMN adenylyltransferase
MAMHILEWDDEFPLDVQGGALTIGNFDGVHRGHQAIAAAVSEAASQSGGPATALTFEPHPLKLLHPEKYLPPITTLEDRAHLLQKAGLNQVVVLHTTSELLKRSAVEFFEAIVLKKFEAHVLVEGRNFGFGRNREGNIELLGALCKGSNTRLAIVPPCQDKLGHSVSSSRVRSALLCGDVIQAAELLGRPYRLRGSVTTGQGRGRQLGFPTANLVDVQTVLPMDGVYAVKVVMSAETWPGAANIGPNPTFEETNRKIEVHLIGFEGNLSRHRLAVDFLKRLRETQRFQSIPELTEQLRRDVENARSLFTGA